MNMKLTLPYAVITLVLLGIIGVAAWQQQTVSPIAEIEPYLPEVRPVFEDANYVPHPVLLQELSDLEPQFVTYKDDETDYDESLSPELLSIKEKLIPLVFGDRNYKDWYANADIYLHAVGPRYVIANALAERDVPPPPQLIDVEAGTTIVLPSYIEFTTGNTAVIVDDRGIYTYTLGDAAPILVPSSVLSGSETYDYCGGCLDSPEVLENHHLYGGRVVVWDFTHSVVREGGRSDPKFVRTFKFEIPQ